MIHNSTAEYDNIEKKYYNDLTTSRFGDKTIKSSIAAAEHEPIDLEKARAALTRELTGNIAAWCFIANYSKHTEILLLTKDFHLIQRVDKPLSREKAILPAIIDFLSFQNDGTITNLLIRRSKEISTMESCTSGLIASNLTDYEGSSAILKGSCITYSNEAKIMAGVDKNIIETFGVYSPETAAEMARTAKKTFHSDIGIGITGTFSNPDPANPDSIAGEVYYQILTDNENPVKLVYHNLAVTRKELKQKTVDIVLAALYSMLTR